MVCIITPTLRLFLILKLNIRKLLVKNTNAAIVAGTYNFNPYNTGKYNRETVRNIK